MSRVGGESARLLELLEAGDYDDRERLAFWLTYGLRAAELLRDEHARVCLRDATRAAEQAKAERSAVERGRSRGRQL